MLRPEVHFQVFCNLEKFLDWGLRAKTIAMHLDIVSIQDGKWSRDKALQLKNREFEKTESHQQY